MTKNQKVKSEFTKYSIMVFIFVFCIVLLGVSLSYAFFSARFTGTSDISTESAANLNVTTTLATAPVINTAKLSLIEPEEYLTKGEKIEFTVTNEATSNVKAKYTLKLVEFQLSRNLFSEYLKWALMVESQDGTTKTYNGNFADENYPEGSDDVTVIDATSKTLISEEEAITLNMNSTDTLTFYIWLENADFNQIYLTNGYLSGKLSMDAYPTK